MIEKEKKVLEEDLSDNLEPIRFSVLDCLDRLRKGADELEEQEIKAENPKFESLINTSKKILITSIRKDSFIESSEIRNYEDALKFKNNLELLINRFGQVGDSHNRILNEFMQKKINKLKNEFDNLSSLLKEVNKIVSIKESEIDRCVACQKDLILLKEKISEREYKQSRLSELRQERQTIDKNIDASNREYEGFQKSKEFLEASNVLNKINDKKNEIGIFEKNMINKVSNLSRPITKFSYLASKETQRKLATILNEPLEIFNDNHQYLELFNELKKQIVEKSIQIKDPEKTIHQIDEIVNSMPSLSSDLRKLKEELSQLESLVNSENMHHLDVVKNKIAMYQKYRSENIANIEETKSNIDGLDSELKQLKKKIEDNAKNITNDRYSIMRSQE
jgi:DNA repair exonuclease SbcCD ATPase subunit